MSIRLSWIFSALCLVFLAADWAAADNLRYCRAAQSGDDPTIFSSNFGVATCNVRARRYHADDYGAAVYAEVDSEDPMVWPTDRWASDLFAGYSRGYDDTYDRRYRGQERALHRAVEKLVSIDVMTATAETARHGFKIGEIEGGRVDWTVHKTLPRSEPSTPGARIWSNGAVCADCRRAGVVRPTARCQAGGSLVITWTGEAAEYRCTTPRTFHRWVR